MAIFRFCKTSGILRLQNVRHKGLDARVPCDPRTPRNSNVQMASTIPAPQPLPKATIETLEKGNEICSRLTTKTPERLVPLLLTLNMFHNLL